MRIYFILKRKRESRIIGKDTVLEKDIDNNKSKKHRTSILIPF